MKTKLELSVVEYAKKPHHKTRVLHFNGYVWPNEYYPVGHRDIVVEAAQRKISINDWEVVELAPSYVRDHEYTECYV